MRAVKRMSSADEVVEASAFIYTINVTFHLHVYSAFVIASCLLARRSDSVVVICCAVNMPSSEQAAGDEATHDVLGKVFPLESEEAKNIMDNNKLWFRKRGCRAHPVETQHVMVTPGCDVTPLRLRS